MSVYHLDRAKRNIKHAIAYIEAGRIRPDNLLEYLKYIDDDLNTIKTGGHDNDNLEHNQEFQKD